MNTASESINAEEVTTGQWPDEVDKVVVTCPNCHERTGVQIAAVREEGLKGRNADCENENCMEEFIIELSASGIEVFKSVPAPLSAEQRKRKHARCGG